MKIKTATLLEYNKEGWLNDYWIGKHTLKKKVRKNIKATILNMAYVILKSFGKGPIN